MLIAQAHLVFVEDLEQEDVTRLQDLNGTSFVEIVKGNFSCSEGIGDVWSEEDMKRGDYNEGDEILIDEDCIPKELLTEIGFEFSGQKRDFDGALIYW